MVRYVPKTTMNAKKKPYALSLIVFYLTIMRWHIERQRIVKVIMFSKFAVEESDTNINSKYLNKKVYTFNLELEILMQKYSYFFKTFASSA